ncbi:MAG: hypothetical protein ACRBB0_12965 [Pelagimonas sp.]|uniref:hypothetical protein n=1 Tax=Pelagimonas sp. TaxID=2073170 RepID=UPI003D6C5AC1
MRWIGWITTLGALAFAGQSGHALWQTTQTEPEQIGPVVQQGPSNIEESAPPQRAVRHWPPIFGEPRPPTPVLAPPTPEPQPPRPPLPPIDSLGYSLKGLVQAGSATWAMVHHPTGEQLVRAGDMLTEEMEVARIDKQGVWVTRGGGEPELLSFAE